MKKFFSVLKVILVIAIIVFIIVRIVKGKYAEFEETAMGDIGIQKYEVEKGDIANDVKGIGQISSFNIETLEIASTDKISEILVQEGAKVEKGQDIMKISDINNKTKTIKAGISGMFFCIENESGTTYCIYNLDDVGVKLLLPEKDISSIKMGQTANVKINALDKEFTGTVSYISSLPQNDRYTVRVKIDYNDELKFGFKGNVKIFIDEAKDVIRIPYEYLKETEDGRFYVYEEKNIDDEMEFSRMLMTGENDENYRTYIEIGLITNSYVEVKSGLEENSVIVMKDYEEFYGMY